MNTPCQLQRAPRSRAVARAALALLALLVVAPALFAYVVKLKDGSLVFARAPYTVKGTRAIITLENGTVTQIDLEKIDVPGTEKYNRENFGNVIAIDTPQEKVFRMPTPVRESNNPLQDLIKEKRGHLDRPTPGPAGMPPGAFARSAAAQPDPIVQAAFAHVFEGTGQSQYRVTNHRGKTRLLATADSEQAVFDMLSASARAVLAAAERGRSAPVEIVLTTASGESAGTFEMTAAAAKLVVDRVVSVQDYFVRNVIF